MEDKYNKKVAKKIYEIIKKYLFEQNDQRTKDLIGCEIKVFLEKEGIDFTTLNYYTPPQLIDMGGMSIEIDDTTFLWKYGTLRADWTELKKPKKQKSQK